MQQVPDIVPVSKTYITDMISNPPRPIEANKWVYQEIYTGSVAVASRGHLGYNLGDTLYLDNLRGQEAPSVEMRTFDGRQLTP